MNNDSWKSTAKSHAGSVRPLNEDSFLNESDFGLWCVADGMGGHSKGEVASALIVEKLSELVANPENPETAPLSVESISLAIDDANNELIAMSKQMGERVGSTVSVLFIQDDIAHVIWAGDSRIYHFSDGNLECITDDHNQAGELVKYGFLKPDKAKHHPGSSLLTRAVGINYDLYLEHKKLKWKASDKFIICSDGLNDVMESDAIEAKLASNESEDISDWLVKTALDNWALDNVTAVTVCCL